MSARDDLRKGMWSGLPAEKREGLIDAYRAEVLREAAATQLAYAREHWTPAAADSISIAGKKDRKYGVAEKLASLIDPGTAFRPRHIRILPHEDGFLVRWQVGEEPRSTYRPTEDKAEAAAAELRGLAAPRSDPQTSAARLRRLLLGGGQSRGDS